MSQERDELRSEVKSFENQLNAVEVDKAALYKEFQSVMDQLSELKENLQVEQKEKEVSMDGITAGEVVRSLGKVLCCMFLLAILGLTVHKTWQIQKVVACAAVCVHTTQQ